MLLAAIAGGAWYGHEWWMNGRFMVSTLPRLQREVWEYQLIEVDFKWKLWVQFSPDGVVREVLQMRHPDMDPPGNDGGKA